MEAYSRIQENLNLRIQKAKKNFKKSPKERLQSSDYLNTRLEALEELWSQFNLTHTQMVQDTDSETFKSSTYVLNDIYDQTEELYIDYKFELKSALTKLSSAVQQNNTTSAVVNSEGATSHSNIRLPKISIPTFSGKYSEWTTFRDLFLSLIHNNQSLDDVQKLHYLKSHLVGEAEQLLRHVNVTEENYSKSWDQLKKRYDNKKYLANHTLKRLLSQRNLTTESSQGIKELLDTTNECLNALKNIGVDTSSWDIIIIYLICLKLDNETRKQWELKASDSSEELPTLSQFNKFLETRFRALEFVEPKTFKGTTSFNHKSSNVTANPKVHHVAALSCAYCSENHRIANCKHFAKVDTDTRRNFVQSNQLCFNCLGINHSVFACRQSTRCRICKRKHHSLLHPKGTTSVTDSLVANQSVAQGVAVPNTASASSSSPDEPIVTEIKTHFSASRSQVLLATALVKAQSKSGTGVLLRCLLDQGSQASLITESAVQLLGLKKIVHNSTISGLGSDESASLASKSRVSLNIQSLLDPKFEFSVNAFVLTKLTSLLPEKRVVVELWSEFTNIKLADPGFDKPDKIDLLLGADIYGQILQEGVIRGPPGAPIAQKTSLGWILSGPIHANTHAPVATKNISVNHIHLSENEILKRFWEIEADISTTSSKDMFTNDEKRCEEIFEATTQRDTTGRYIVKLPFRDTDPACKYGNSEAIATRRFLQLERKFTRDPQFKARYSEVVEEYLKLGHMEKVPNNQHDPNVVYLPHHAVKIRLPLR